MSCIRFRYHYGGVVLDGSGRALNKSMTSNKVAVLLKDGTEKLFEFGGFLPGPLPDIPRPQRVKLLHIAQFTDDEDGLKGWISIPKNHYCVGVFKENRCYMVLDSCAPITHPLAAASSKPKPKREVGNVVVLRDVTRKP